MKTTLHDLDVARHLVRLGVPLFLAGLDGNGDPLCPKAWQQTEPGDLTPVNDYRPGMALCAVMGHTFDVLDVDPRNGGTESARRLRAELGDDMPRIYARVSTPSAGWHCWLAPLGIGKHTGFMPGLDLQGGKLDGRGRGFAFIPPTVRPSKMDGEPRAYQWTEAPHQAPEHDSSGVMLVKLILDAVTPAPAERAPRPASTAAEITSGYVRTALTGELAAVASSPAGGRNVQLNRSAYALARFIADGQLDADATADALTEAASAAGLGYAEAASTIRSAFTARGAV